MIGNNWAALAQLAGAVGTFSLREQAAIGGLRPVPGTDWILVVVRPASVASVVGTRVWTVSVTFLGASIALAMFLGWVFSYNLTEPISLLRDSVLAVADGDYGRRADVKSTDEVGELARAFNHMSARLLVNQQEIEDQHQQIVGFNEELQERVERRTQQLMAAQDQLVRSGQLAAVAEVGAGLAHELNNPLAAILGTAQVLRMKAGDSPNAALLESLEEQAQRCREVVGAMVRFSSGEEVDPENAPVVDLRDIIVDVTTLVRGPFRQLGGDLADRDVQRSPPGSTRPGTRKPNPGPDPQRPAGWSDRWDHPRGLCSDRRRRDRDSDVAGLPRGRR